MVPSPFELAGYVVTDEFLSTGDCRQLLGRIDDYRSTTDLPEIHRTAKGRNLRYLVIDGYEIKERLADIWDLYTGSVRTYVSEVAGEEMFPLQNLRAGVNVHGMETKVTRRLPANDGQDRWLWIIAPVVEVEFSF